MQKNRLLIVDGNNLLFQMFFGMPSKFCNKKGETIHATIGFISFVLKQVKVYGASNLTGNKETVAKLFDGSRDILIPVHLLGSITDEVINQVMDDKVMTKNV